MKLFQTVSLAAVLCFSCVPSTVMAQAAHPVKDNSKYKQWRAMENGKWDFNPGWYYGVTHAKYSGSKFNLFGWKFKESRSNVKRCFTPRAAQVPGVVLTKVKAETMSDSITPLLKEETERAADRNIDAVYPVYQNDFKQLQEYISNCLSIALEDSKGKLSDRVKSLTDRNDLLCERIRYIHKTGPGYELENSKRQKAYEEAREDMKVLASHCFNLALLAHYTD